MLFVSAFCEIAMVDLLGAFLVEMICLCIFLEINR